MKKAPACLVTDATYALWERLGEFSAGETDAALRHLMDWLVRELDADNAVWIGAVRALRGAAAKDDLFYGWRLRVRQPLKPETASYRRLLADYYARQHYGKLTPTYYVRSHEEGRDAHIGMTGRASLAGAGRFRVHRLRDGWIDFAAFRRTAHYKLYFLGEGIVDRLTIGFPVGADAESFLLIHRQHRKGGPRRRPFSAREAAIAGGAVRGARELQRRLFLSHGLSAGDKPLSPTQRRVLHGLLDGHTEKKIAAATGQPRATLHKYVTALFRRFGVNSRSALMARWLNGP